MTDLPAAILDGWVRLKLLVTEDVYNPMIIENSMQVESVRARLLADVTSAMCLSLLALLFILFVVHQIRYNPFKGTTSLSRSNISRRLLLRAILLSFVLMFNISSYVMSAISILWDIKDQLYSSDSKRAVVMAVFILSCLYKPRDLLYFKHRLTDSTKKSAKRE